MFAKLLNEIIANRVLLQAVQNWLDNDEKPPECVQCTKIEFVSNFLSVMRSRSEPQLSVRQIPIQTAVRLTDRIRKEPVVVHSTPVKNRTKIELKTISGGEPSKRIRVAKDRQTIDQLIDFYCFLIERKLIANIFIEFEFLVSLMSVTYATQMLKRNEILCDADTCAYFATNAILCLVGGRAGFAMFFDPQMLQFLSEFVRESTVSVRNKDRVLKLLDTLCTSSASLSSSTIAADLNDSTVNTLVCHFDSDLNSLANFPTAKACSKFCKQRDQFFRIYEEWSTKRFDANWQFAAKLTLKINALMAPDAIAADDSFDDRVNLMHLARLFLAQLLKTVGQTNDGDGDVNGAAIMTSGRDGDGDGDGKVVRRSRLDRAKIEKLEKRIVRDPNGLMYEDFFVEFVRVAVNGSFLFVKFLIDEICAELFERLDEAVTVLMTAADSFDLLRFLNVMKLMARFLAFIDTQTTYSKSVLDFKAFERLKIIKPYRSLSLSDYLTGKPLLLTIPWLCEYLKQFTNRQSLNTELNDLLTLSSMIRTRNTNPKITFVIWIHLMDLFEKFDFCESERFFAKSTDQPIYDEISDTKLESRINCDLMFACFPILTKIKASLCSQSTIFIKQLVPFKQIKPIMLDAKPNAEPVNGHETEQLTLEESFLNIHPKSVRKTIDFLSERISSTCIKSIFADIMPVVKQQMLSMLTEWFREQDSTTETFMKNAEETFRNEMLPILIESFRSESEKKMQLLTETRPSVAIHALMPVDMPTAILDCCSKITKRRANDKTRTWIRSQSDDVLFLKKSFKECLRKLMVAVPAAAATATAETTITNRLVDDMSLETIDKFLAPSLALIQLKEQLFTISLLNRSSCDGDDFNVLTKQILESVRNRCDFNESNFYRIAVSLVDTCLLFVSKDMEDRIAYETVLAVWKLYRDKFGRHLDVFERIVSPRNLFMVRRQRNDFRSFSNLLVRLLDGEFVTEKSLVQQITKHCNQDEIKDLLSSFETNSTSASTSTTKLNFVIKQLTDKLESEPST